MGFVSILGDKPWQNVSGEPPDFFVDLNLDQVLEVIAESKKEYAVEEYFYQFADDEETIRYRQDVFKDLEDGELLDDVVAFSRTMLKAHEYRGYYDECTDEWQKKHWHLDVADTYCKAINGLREALARTKARSRGFTLLREWLEGYCGSGEYQTLDGDTRRLVGEFGTIRYGLEIDADKVVVNATRIEGDYCKDIKKVFGDDGEAPYMENPLAGTLEMPHLEQRILGVLMGPYREVFDALSQYCDRGMDFMDGTALTFEREVQFYLAFLSFKSRLEARGCRFAYPTVGGGTFQMEGLYDLALAWRNLSDSSGGSPSRRLVVCNDAHYVDEERFLVVTGPNQGGKTTFARAMGQIVYCAKMGMPVPCTRAQLPFIRGLLTHFSVEESLETGKGKLKEELIRLKPMMAREARDSFVVINELFTTAATYDAYLMGKKVVDYFLGRGVYGVYVTHISDLAKESAKVASMTAGIDKEDGGRRTYRVERRPAEGVGYANTLVDKYQLSYQDVRRYVVNSHEEDGGQGL